MNNSALVGRAASIEVSDPWEFVSIHGSGPFAVDIEAVDGGAMLVRLRAPYRYRDTDFSYLAATARHSNAALDALSSGMTVPVNLVPLAQGGDIRAWKQAASSWRGWHLVGSLRL